MAYDRLKTESKKNKKFALESQVAIDQVMKENAELLRKLERSGAGRQEGGSKERERAERAEKELAEMKEVEEVSRVSSSSLYSP